MKKIAVIIVTFNSKEFIGKCVDSLLHSKLEDNLALEIFIFDNASTDGTRQYLKSQISNPKSQNQKPEARSQKPENSKFQIHNSSVNIGFAKANNYFLKKINVDYILFLNPDTYLQSDTVNKLVLFLDKHNLAAAVAPKILNKDLTLQPSVRKFPFSSAYIFILLKLHNLFPNLKPLQKYFCKKFNYNKTSLVEQVMGACFMIKQEMLHKIGFFDEQFFLWFEEVDWCKRAKKLGYEIYYYPEASIIHYGGESFKKLLPLKKQLLFNESLLKYFNKYHKKEEYIIIKFFSYISLSITFIFKGIKNENNKKFQK